eukprot:CAMPEP_0172159534 /NCGR_PEP_ID=MMETSP1050-20130122/5024_1 /TAXON_ID=233186 /ORGANISM="Cryptomonas curvata, Strain CCAP979/52" /LENGTH=153 /DNA_ID=CAMNT_0012829133 /DNA_START=200 /DNA_END=662 /DNA_ORIENTATION=-
MLFDRSIFWTTLFDQSDFLTILSCLTSLYFSALKAPEPVVNNIPQGTARNNLGDLNAAVEIPLGCFGDAKEDQCCDDASDPSSQVPFLSTCSVSLERCVRPATNPACARDDDSRPGQCSGEADSSSPGCTAGPAPVCMDLPLCAPRGITSSLD